MRSHHPTAGIDEAGPVTTAGVYPCPSRVSMEEETRCERLRRLTEAQLETRRAFDQHDDTAVVMTLGRSWEYVSTGHSGIEHEKAPPLARQSGGEGPSHAASGCQALPGWIADRDPRRGVRYPGGRVQQQLRLDLTGQVFRAHQDRRVVGRP